ncbi:MAG: coiled-coil domain-containing protein [Bdellovibrionota bacterium]
MKIFSLQRALLLVVLAFSAVARAEDDPCKGAAGAAMSCDQQEKCIDSRFKEVLSKDPNVACRLNNDAGWDKSVAAKLNDKSDPSCNGTVCASTYLRLQRAVKDYKKAAGQACNMNSDPKGCLASAGDDQNAAFKCAKAKQEQALELSKMARKALETAKDEAANYRKLTQEVKKKYDADQDKIQEAEDAMRTQGQSMSDITAAKQQSAVVNGDTFGSGQGGGVLSQLNATVDARNGGAQSLADYENRQKQLTAEQDRAAATIDAFNKAAKVELDNRTRLEAALTAESLKTAKLSTSSGPISSNDKSTITGKDSGSGKSDSSSDSLLNQATNLTKLASAGTSLASAMNKSGASQAQNFNSGYPGSGEGPAQPGTTGASGPTTSSFGSNGSPTGGSTSPTPIPPGQGALDRTHLGQNSNVDGNSGHSARGYMGGDLTASADQGASHAGGYGFGSSGSSSSGASEGIKDEGRAPASKDNKAGACTGSESDCAAMNDLKTPQFNAGGALGMPKIGAADPALATKGALENIFGPIPSLDSLIPKPTDPTKSGPAMDGLVVGFENPAVVAEPGQQVAAAIEPAASRSLFVRVHSVHEMALKRGSVSLYHKKL